MSAPEVTAAEIAAAKAQMPLAFRPPLAQRLRNATLWVGFFALFGWCLYDFDFSPLRIIYGFDRFLNVLGFMFPPYIWTEWSEIADILNGLGETLAMAFLGTMLGALIAFPLAFLGAKTINKMNWLRLGFRRGFDVIRSFETLFLARDLHPRFWFGAAARCAGHCRGGNRRLRKALLRGDRKRLEQAGGGGRGRWGLWRAGDPLCNSAASAAGLAVDHAVQL